MKSIGQESSPIISTQISLNELQKQTHGTDATAVTCPPEHRGTREATVYGRPFWWAAAPAHPMGAIRIIMLRYIARRSKALTLTI